MSSPRFQRSSPPPPNDRGARAAALAIPAALALLAALAPLDASAESPRTARYASEYLLIDHLDSAITVRLGLRPAKASLLKVDFDQRRVLVQRPSSALRFPGVPAGDGAVFETAVTMDPRVWERPTDGVGFEVLCRGVDGSLTTLLELVISPASNPDDRKWHERQVPLDVCSSPATDIELRTSCGPGDDCAADWPVWGDPRVVNKELLEPRPKRLALLISIDTLRADRLGLYGAERQTSPQLDRLAEDAVVFETAIAPAPWTIPSHATMLTSTDPRVHGANAKTPISKSATSIAEILQRAGWHTAGFVDAPYMSTEFGFHRGFEHFDDDPPRGGSFRRGAPVTRMRLLDWLAGANDRPAFVFWHLMDVHGPYQARAPFAGMFRRTLVAPASADPDLEKLKQLGYHRYLRLRDFHSLADLVAAYDEGVATVDALIGGLLQILRDAGLYDQALIVVTSDHGESFLDHGVWVGHGLFLTDDEVRVPLIVKLPGNRHGGLRVRGPVGLIDVAPSMLDALGMAVPSSFQGQSLLSPEPGSPESLPAAVYGFSNNVGAASIRTGSFKYISAARRRPADVLRLHLKARADAPLPLETLLSEQLYDLRRDPQETTPRTDFGSSGLGRFRAALNQYDAQCAARRKDGGSPDSASPNLLSEEAIERLRALGYVD